MREPSDSSTSAGRLPPSCALGAAREGRGRGRRHSPRRRPARWGFSLLELLVVLAVTVILTGLMLPALTQVRENLHRIMCSSNLRQIGYGVFMFARENDDALPFSRTLAEYHEPWELMAANTGGEDGWDGLGILFRDGYCSAQDCYYCPSHRGEHPVDRYDWRHPTEDTIYTNYHYAGHVDWVDLRPRRLEDGEKLVLATDGFRTVRDFNHVTGMNILRGDGGVHWYDDSGTDTFASHLPESGDGNSVYQQLWSKLEDLGR
jgi:hypothetical protein